MIFSGNIFYAVSPKALLIFSYNERKPGSGTHPQRSMQADSAKHAGRNPNTGTRQKPTRPCSHLADTGQDRKRRKSHSLDRKADHIHKRQWNVEHTVSDQEHRHTTDDLRLIRVHKEKRDMLSAKEQDHKRDQGSRRYRSGLPPSVPLSHGQVSSHPRSVPRKSPWFHPEHQTDSRRTY